VTVLLKELDALTSDGVIVTHPVKKRTIRNSLLIKCFCMFLTDIMINIMNMKVFKKQANLHILPIKIQDSILRSFSSNSINRLNIDIIPNIKNIVGICPIVTWAYNVIMIANMAQVVATMYFLYSSFFIRK
jgi:hypothetical protein